VKLLKIFLFISLVNLGVKLPAQDIQFSQFYAASLYLNPAFAGSAHAPRISIHERIQWPGLDAKYTTSMVSADHFFSKYHSGVGLIVLQDIQGSSVIKSTEVQLQYSYELGISKSLSFRSGLQVGMASRTINYSHLLYPDQYNDQGYAGATTDPTYGGQRITYPDISSGGVLYSDRFWVGVSAHHLNEPNQSFVDGVSRLPAKFAIVAGYRFIKNTTKLKNYKRENQLILIPTVHYKMQGKSDQLDVGIYGIYNNVILGGWYRGIPIKNYSRNLPNNESIVILGGYKFKTLSISYSYDITISKLNIVRTIGAHELNITYTHKGTKKRKPMRRLPCPKFHD